MTGRTEYESLDERSRTLLKTLVERYVRSGEPIGSRTLARTSGLGLSPATVRNVMADLEDLGFVSAPHTSAGRIPTVLGYRFFVDALLAPEPLPSRKLADIERQLRAQIEHGGDLVESASRLLASLSDMAGVVTVPRQDVAHLRQIEFLPLSGRRVLAILVINQHEVQNRVLQTERTFSAAELERAANFLNEQFSGRSLPEIRDALARELRDARSDVGEAVAMGRRALAADGDRGARDYVLAGETHLMDFPEFGRVERLRDLFEALREKRDLLSLFEECLSAEGVQIFIGSESGYRVLDECSVVTAPYTADGEVVGTLGVIGPTRMAYGRIIPLVAATAGLLGSALKSRN